MNVTYEKKKKMTYIGYHTEISPEEAYQKCPEFWDKEYAAKYVRLWQTMQPENAVEKAILDNGIGMHDATWRTTFGGDIYMENGSHGCVNLPETIAEVLFEQMSVGTPVVVFG